jgi:tetratricopeptide (TPR) repeat protein
MEMTTAITSAAAEGSAQTAAPGGPWIYRPSIDLLIGCGGWSAPLLAFSFATAQSNSRAWPVVFYALALLFNYPHFMATVYRAYHSYTEFAKYRIFTVHVAALLGLAGLLAHVWYPALPWIFTLYICWSPWHYTGQNFGILMLFARRAGVAPSAAERRALHWAFVASFVPLMLSFHTGASGDPLILSLGLAARYTLPARAVLAVFFVAASGWAFYSMARRGGWRAIAPSLLLTVTQFLWFLLPAMIELASGRDVPQTRYSSGILAVLHSTQYLWITSYYQAREARATAESWRLGRYLVTLMAGGIALFIPGPWIASRIFHADFAASFLTFTALVNLHHFILDGAIWKLRDSRIASFLLNKETAGGGAAGGGPTTGVLAGVRWFAGRSQGARALRWAAAGILFLWAAMDQVHFYWANETGSVAALEQATRLNPNDSGTQTRLARAEARAGRVDEKIAALRAAAAANATNFSLQEAFARGLIEAGRDAEAHAEYARMLERWPRSVDALVNYGLLAARLGLQDQAVDSWQRAVALDAGQANAQLYLAQALEARGELQAAARHYRAYLGIVAARASEYRGEENSVLAALIKVGDADAAGGRVGDAVEGYRAAARYAEQSGRKSLQSLALAHLAEVQDRQGDVGGALRSYQGALRLDAGSDDLRSAGIDWLNYGQFLRRRGAGEMFAYGCFLRARELLRQSGSAEEVAVAERALAEIPPGVGRKAGRETKDRGDISTGALSVRAEDLEKER